MIVLGQHISGTVAVNIPRPALLVQRVDGDVISGTVIIIELLKRVTALRVVYIDIG